MDQDADDVRVFVQGRAGTAFVLWLCLGMASATAAAMLLPWPPTPFDSIVASFVLLVCGAVAWGVGGRRVVRLERSTRTLIERTTLAGWTRERRLPLASDARVEVTRKTIQVARPARHGDHRTPSDHDTHQRFQVALRSGPRKVAMDLHADALDAERRSLEVAAICGVPAVRSGYAVDVRPMATGATLSAGMPTVVRIRTDNGPPSAITPGA